MYSMFFTKGLPEPKEINKKCKEVLREKNLGTIREKILKKKLPPPTRTPTSND